MKNILIAFGILLVLVIGGVGVWYFINKNSDKTTEIIEDNDTDKIYTSIEVNSLDESVSHGSIWVEEGKLHNDVTALDLKSYIMLNQNIWETEQQAYPTGGMLDDGTLWDGSAFTSIGMDDFLVAIYVQLDDEFGDKYSFDLTQ